MSQADLSIAIALTGESQAVSALQRIQQGIVNASSGFRSASESASAFTSGLRSMAEAENALHVSLQNSITDLRAQRSALMDPGFREAQQEAARLRGEIDAMSRPQQQATNGWMSMGNAVRGFMALQVVGYVKNVSMAIYEATAEMDSLRRGLTAVMGSSARAAVEMERLREVAKLPGLGYAEAIRMSTSLQASGMSAKMARDAMMSFGNALATVGKGKAELDGVGVALSQIMAKGKVSAEEINQIAERIPQIRVAMQAAFGTASTELLQSMGITSKEFISGITGELGKMEKVSGGLRTGTENLSDAWFEFKANLGGTGELFQDIAAAGGAALAFLNRKMAEGKQQQIDSAMDGIARVKALQKKAAESSTYAAWVGKDTIKEWDKQLAGYRAFLAKQKAIKEEAAKKEDPEAEKLKIVREAIARETKATRASALDGARNLFASRMEMAKSDAKTRADVEKWYRERVAEINKEWDEKEKKPTKKTDTKYGADQESARLIEQALEDESAVQKIREQTQIMNLKAAKDGIEDVAQLREIDREVEAMQLHAKYVDEQNAARGSKEKLKAIQDQYRAALRVLNAQWDAEDAADVAKEAKAYAKRLEERAKAEREANAKSFNDRTKEGVTAYKSEVSLWQSRLGIYNSSLSEMLSGDKSYHAAAREMWETTKSTAITSILELGEKWIAEKIAMATFSDAMRAEEVAANGTQAAIIAAQDATPAALASTMSFGSAAVIGGAALAAAVAMAASFDVGTPSVQGDQFAKIHNRETILPTWASIPAQRGDWGPAQRFMGQTGGTSSTSTSTSSQTNHVNNSTSSTQVVVYTQMSPTQYARAARRGELVQGRTRSARSH